MIIPLPHSTFLESAVRGSLITLLEHRSHFLGGVLVRKWRNLPIRDSSPLMEGVNIGRQQAQLRLGVCLGNSLVVVVLRSTPYSLPNQELWVPTQTMYISAIIQPLNTGVRVQLRSRGGCSRSSTQESWSKRPFYLGRDPKSPLL